MAEQPVSLDLAIDDDVFGQGIGGRDVEVRQVHPHTERQQQNPQGICHFEETCRGRMAWRLISEPKARIWV